MIVGAEFAVWAWGEACRRAAPKFLPGTTFGSCGSRADADTGLAIYAPEAEYYRILDKAAACFDHLNATFMSGTVTGPYRCVL